MWNIIYNRRNLGFMKDFFFFVMGDHITETFWIVTEGVNHIIFGTVYKTPLN